MSTLSLVIPFKVTFMGLLEKGPRAIRGSRKYPTALEVPQSWYTLPPTITPGLYTIEVPIQQYRPSVSFFLSDMTRSAFRPFLAAFVNRGGRYGRGMGVVSVKEGRYCCRRVFSRI